MTRQRKVVIKEVLLGTNNDEVTNEDVSPDAVELEIDGNFDEVIETREVPVKPKIT